MLLTDVSKTIDYRLRVTGTSGYIPEKVEDTDWDISQSSLVSGGASIDTDNSDFFKEISNQSYLPACTGNAAADLLEAVEAYDLYKSLVTGSSELRSPKECAQRVTNKSRMFGWWHGRNMMDPPQNKNPRSGCWNRLLSEVVVRMGLPDEVLWPYDEALVGALKEPRPVVRPSITASHNARQHVCTSFFAVKSSDDARLSEVTAALRKTPGLTVGINLAPEFFTYRGGVLPRPKSLSKDWHSVVIVGYDSAEKAFKLRNSWGVDFGEGGYFRISEAYLASRTYARGIYAYKR